MSYICSITHTYDQEYCPHYERNWKAKAPKAFVHAVERVHQQSVTPAMHFPHTGQVVMLRFTFALLYMTIIHSDPSDHRGAVSHPQRHCMEGREGARFQYAMLTPD